MSDTQPTECETRTRREPHCRPGPLRPLQGPCGTVRPVPRARGSGSAEPGPFRSCFPGASTWFSAPAPKGARDVGAPWLTQTTAQPSPWRPVWVLTLETAKSVQHRPRRSGADRGSFPGTRAPARALGGAADSSRRRNTSGRRPRVRGCGGPQHSPSQQLRKVSVYKSEQSTHSSPPSKASRQTPPGGPTPAHGDAPQVNAASVSRAVAWVSPPPASQVPPLPSHKRPSKTRSAA